MGRYIGLIVLLMAIFLSGCDAKSTHNDVKMIMKTDLNELQKLIHVPFGAKRCEWQTGNRAAHGDDWWLAAVLEIEIEQISNFLQGAGINEVFETPLGIKLISSFATLNLIPQAEPTESNGIRLIADTYSIAPYKNSPLLNGKVLRLTESQILVVLWTN